MIEIRHQRISDAKRFYEILTNPSFKYFNTKPKNIEKEKEFLRKNKDKIHKNIEHNFTIICDGGIVGGIGVKINQHRKYIGEIGYFIDQEYWGKGIATMAVKLLEKICFKKLNITRIEIVMVPENKASEKVAIKCRYQKEGLMKKALMNNKKRVDAFLYSKVR
jgi:[ribosomal protein S5]-alanine N-acetyltransferase